MLDQRARSVENPTQPPPRSHASRRPPAWAIYLLLAVPLFVIYRFLPEPIMYSVIYDVFAFTSLAAILIGVRINRPTYALPWYLLAAGVGSWLVGDMLWTYFEYVAHTAPFPSAADAIYLLAYVFFASGIYLIVRKHAPKRDRSLLLDAAIITIGAGLLGWMFLMAPYADDPGLSLVEKLVSIAYPVGDVLILSVLVRVFLGTRTRSPAYILLACGLLVCIASDIGYSLMLLNGRYVPGHFVDFGWLLFYVLWGLAALHPSMAALSRPESKPRRPTSPWRLASMALAAILAPLVALIQLTNGDSPQIPVITAGSVVIFLLVVLRMGGLLTRVELAHAKMRRLEREKGELLDRTMQVGEEERVRVATELHDGPIQQLSAVAYRFEAALLQLQRGDHESAALSLAKVRDSFGHEIDTLREMMQGLRPPELDERGLRTALQDLLSAFRQSSGIHGTLETEGPLSLRREIETAFFRVTQEALANVARHSRGGIVRIEVRDDQQRTQLSVTDDGVGFDASSSTTDLADGQFGLIAMRQHIEALGGRFVVTSSDTGTRIVARFDKHHAAEIRSDPPLVSAS